MKFLRKFLNSVFVRKPKTFPAPDTEFAFEVGGKRFFSFKNDMAMPVERALSAQDIYNEIALGVDKEYLKTLFTTLAKFLDKGKLVDASSLLKMASGRLTHISNVQLMYKLASVLYIEEGEDPRRFDMAAAERKIEFWLENEKDIEAFFLKMPIGEFLPYLGKSDMSFLSYSQTQLEQVSQMLEHHMNLLSEESGVEEEKNTLKLQLQQIKTTLSYLTTP